MITLMQYAINLVKLHKKNISYDANKEIYVQYVDVYI